ncbi:MAG: DUF6734 family protein [Salegentibacter mishustinae]|nr:DUF6734 family protein [Salegentibacter mishustinae]
MKIVQSFWSGKTGVCEKSYGWHDPFSHYLGWILSVNQLKRFYAEVELVTDKAGYEILITKLNLPYTKVHVVLDRLNGYNENLWALAKMYAYQLFDEPFIHVDGDVFIWKPFPEELLKAQVIVQNKEIISGYYDEMWCKIRGSLNYLPEELRMYENGTSRKAYNMGIFGGNDVEFFKKYSQKAFQFIRQNKNGLTSLEDININIFFEQVLLYNMSNRYNKKVECLIDEEIGDNEYKGFGNFDEVPTERTYLHLLGFFKRQQDVMVKLQIYVLKYYPEFYKKAELLFNGKTTIPEYQYSESHNQILSKIFEQQLIKGGEHNFYGRLDLVSRSIYMEAQPAIFKELLNSNTNFCLKRTSKFDTVSLNGEEFMTVEYLNFHRKLPMLAIDGVIFSLLQTSIYGRAGIERFFLKYLNEDFPKDSIKAYLDTVWKRIYYLISVDLLVAIPMNKISIKP